MVGPAVLGSCVGLAIGAAYMAGALARNAVDGAQARFAIAPALRGTTAPLVVPSTDAPPPRIVLQTTHRWGPLLARLDLRRHLTPTRDLECLSQAVYYEARGEAQRGREAVAQVVLNRTRHPRFPKSVCAVVFQRAASGCAFSFTCDGQTRHPIDAVAWRDAREIARRALSGFTLPDLANATDFRGGHGGPPVGLMRVAQIGAHVFYRPDGRAPPRPAPPAASPQPAAPSPAPVVMKIDAPSKTEASPTTPSA